MTIAFKTKTCKIDKISNIKYKLTITDGEKFKKFWKNIKSGLKITEEKKDFIIFEAENVLSLSDLLKKKR